MATNRGGQIDECIELLQLTGASHGEESGDGEFAVRATVAKHDLAPLHRGAQRALRRVVRRLDALLVDEREEMLMVHEQRAGQIADVVVGGIDVALSKCEELFLDRERLGDQLLTSERRAAGMRISVKAMPQAKELSLQGKRLA